MGAVAALGAAAAAASLGSTIANATSGGGGGGATGQGTYNGVYIPQSLGAADSLYSSGFTPLQNASSNIQNNPYAGLAQNTANQAGAYGTGTLAPAEQGAASQLFGLGNQASPYASQILQTGFDPQNALYNRTQQQVTDQLNAQNALNGLSSTPYGAGVAGQGISNFNIDWQNQQLQRQATAAQGYGALTNSIGQAYSGAAGLGTQGFNTLNTAGSLPYNTYQGQQTNDINAIGSQGAYAQPYLGLGNASGALGLSASNAAFAQQQQLSQQLGQGLSGLGGLFSGGGGIGGLSSSQNLGLTSLSPSTFSEYSSAIGPGLIGSP